MKVGPPTASDNVAIMITLPDRDNFSVGTTAKSSSSRLDSETPDPIATTLPVELRKTRQPKKPVRDHLPAVTAPANRLQAPGAAALQADHAKTARSSPVSPLRARRPRASTSKSALPKAPQPLRYNLPHCGGARQQLADRRGATSGTNPSPTARLTAAVSKTARTTIAIVGGTPQAHGRAVFSQTPKASNAVSAQLPCRHDHRKQRHRRHSGSHRDDAAVRRRIPISTSGWSIQRSRLQLRRPSGSEGGVCCKPELDRVTPNVDDEPSGNRACSPQEAHRQVTVLRSVR